MSKVTVVGAGNVGATCANVLAVKGVANHVCLIDIKEGLAQGKAMDIMQTAHSLNFNTVVEGVTNDYSATKDSDVVVITSGIPRKPGMTREELIGVNAGIVKTVVESILKYSPNAILIVVSNPMDTMAYLTLHAFGLPRNRVIGMGGMLDSSRLKYFIAKAMQCNANDVDGFVIGGHGDTTMIPLVSYMTYKGIPISHFLSSAQIDEIVHSTMVGGATLTGLLGTSAWMAPGASACCVVEAILKNTHKMIPCSVALDGEYGMHNITIGVPCVLGRNGLEKILELKLSEDEMTKFKASANAVNNTNAVLKTLNVL